MTPSGSSRPGVCVFTVRPKIDSKIYFVALSKSEVIVGNEICLSSMPISL